MEDDMQSKQEEPSEFQANKPHNKRDCYCELWDTDPKHMEKQGIPRGYCGKCEVCGKPGHIRHHPGSAPYTGGWCDYHYRKLAWTHPMAFPGGLIWIGGLVAIIFVFKWLL